MRQTFDTSLGAGPDGHQIAAGLPEAPEASDVADVADVAGVWVVLVVLRRCLKRSERSTNSSWALTYEWYVMCVI